MIVGVDLSTYRIDLAWISARGRPQRWHQELGSHRVDTIDRIRAIDIHWPVDISDDVTEVCIEWPWGRGKALPPLMAVTGIVTRQAPTWARVSWVKSHDLRAAIGAKNTKEDAHAALLDHLIDAELETWDEHELDALVTCLAWTRILDKQEAA